MDHPPPPPGPPLPPLPTPTTIHLNYPDPSSPRSSHVPDTAAAAATAAVEPQVLPPVPGAKLRLMCSYGGHIIPRPHDKSLCYVGGETRMVALDRHSSLASLSSRLSRTLLNGRPFTLKYQLPNEDLDSLVSVTTDEDLDNMFEEYERITAATPCGGGCSDHTDHSSSGRIRLFLFCNKPETSASMGSLLDDAKSETWFVDALNGSGLLLPRNLSDSATMDNCLVNLGSSDNHYHRDLEANQEAGSDKSGSNNNDGALHHHHHQVNNAVVIQDLHSTMPGSPAVENNSSSSFGSSSSSPCMANLAPVRVRVAASAEDQGKQGGGAAVEEQLAQMSFVHKQQQLNNPGEVAGGGSSENLTWLLSDDERSDQGVPVSFRKPPLPLQPVQPKPGAAFYNLPSPDSVASDTSVASAGSLTKPMYYQDQSQLAQRPSLSPDTKTDVPVPTSQIHAQQVQDSTYPMQPHLDQQQQQQQYLPTGTQLLPNPATTPVAMPPSYYTVYAAAPSQQQQQHQQQHHQQQQYPVYVMPVTHAHPYMSVQSNMVDTTIVASSRPGATAPAAPAVLTTSAVYKDVQLQHPPIYPPRAAATTSVKAEVPSTMYAAAMTSSPSLVQVPITQFQNQYVGYSQVQYPTQPTSTVAPSAAAGANNYAYDYNSTVTHDQVYYTHQQQQVAAPLPPLYQTMTPAAAVALTDTSNQQAASNILQQIAASQPN